MRGPVERVRDVRSLWWDVAPGGDGRTLRTGGVVPEGVCTVPNSTTGTLRTGRRVLQGVCTVQAATSVQTPSRTGSPVYKADRAEKPSVQTPSRTGSPVYKPGLCALGQFGRDLYGVTRLHAMTPHRGPAPWIWPLHRLAMFLHILWDTCGGFVRIKGQTELGPNLLSFQAVSPVGDTMCGTMVACAESSRRTHEREKQQ